MYLITLEKVKDINEFTAIYQIMTLKDNKVTIINRIIDNATLNYWNEVGNAGP